MPFKLGRFVFNCSNTEQEKQVIEWIKTIVKEASQYEK